MRSEKSFNNEFLSELLLSNKYYYNIVEDAYMNKVGFLKIRSQILKKIRLLLSKKIKMNFFSKDLKIRSSKISLSFNFFKCFLSLKKLKSFFYVLTGRVKSVQNEFFFKSFNDSYLVQEESISFFRNRRKKFLPHNPFLKLEDNFLLLIYN